MSNLSELLPAGAGAKSAEFVASGTLGSGVTVALKSDGTVEAISATGGGPAAGTSATFESAQTDHISTTFDSSNNKVVIAYRDDDNATYGTAIVGTVSGASISFGTPVIFNSGRSDWNSLVFDSTNNKVVLMYADGENSYYATGIVGTVSGTSISFGSAVVAKTTRVSYISTTFDSTNNKIVIAYTDFNNSSYGKAIVGTVSGTSISFGSETTFNSASGFFNAATFDSNSNKVVIAYRNDGNSSYGTAIVGTVSGTSISFGSAVVFESSRADGSVATFDSSNNKVVIAYQDPVNTDAGTAIVGTVSGTSISFGTPVVIDTSVSTTFGITFDSANNKVIIAYVDIGNSSYGTAIVGTVSGTTISFGSPTVFENASTALISATFDSNSNGAFIAYRDEGNSNYGTSVVFQVASTNSADFIGITDQAIADTATGAVIVQGGVSDKVTGLTTGSDYYVQANGTLSTTVSSAPAGRALSSTSILLEG